MQYSYLENFLQSYSAATVVITCAVTVIKMITDRFFNGKISRIIGAYLPVAIAVVCEYVYDFIFVTKGFRMTADPLYAGIICGSLATALSVFLKKLTKGENVSFNAAALLIDGILEGYVPDTVRRKAVEAIISVLNSGANESEELALTEKVCEIIRQYSENGFTEDEIRAVGKLIIETSKSLKKIG